MNTYANAKKKQMKVLKMAKKIFASDADIEAFLRSSQAQLLDESRNIKNKKFQSGAEEIKLSFRLPECKDARKATIEFTEKAWIKIYALVNSYSTEVQWHGIVERVSQNVFRIKDVLVFPHEVTGTTVISTQDEYEKWLDALDNETFNGLRFHGHSHVNMGVSPSGVDMEYRRKILNNFGTPTNTTDYFYIFLIFNKKGEISGEIYDLQNNALYSTDEITILGCEWLANFLTEAKTLVKERTYSGFGGYSYSGVSNYGNNNTHASNPVITAPTTQAKVVQPQQAQPSKKKYYSPKLSSKRSAISESPLDDDDPDPLDDDYYSDLRGYGGGYRY